MLILVFGLPASGKTYFAKRFAGEIGAEHLNTDIIREELGLKGRYDEKSKQKVYERLFESAAESLKRGRDVILDGTFHKQERRGRVKKLASEKNAGIYFIRIHAGENTAKKRLSERRNYSEADFKVYQQIKMNFEPCDEVHLALWSDRTDIEEMIRKAKQYIYE